MTAAARLAGEPERLGTGAAALGVALSDLQVQHLLDYIDLLERWNRTYNLTAVRERAAMLEQHLLDCLAMVPALRREFHRESPTAPRLLDVGSGGGLPGVVLAVVMPDLAVTCVDAVGKKAAFVRQVAGALGLHNLEAVHARAEAMRPQAFDVITSRAFASLADFTRWTRQHLAPRGVWVAMKGQRPGAEIAELPQTIDVFHVEPLHGLDAERCLVWMRPYTPKAS